jgi:hypothetical protein
MSKERSRHTDRKERARRRWNRGDLAILLCGMLAFLSISFGAPLFHQIQASAGGNSTRIGSAAAGTMSPEPAPAALPTPETHGMEALDSAPAPIAVGAPADALPPAAGPVRVRYAAAGFDVPIHALDLDAEAQASQTIEPPATKDGYWLTAFGIPGQESENTTYVIGHSWEGADAPFNHLSSAAAVGDGFEVDTATGTIPYKVDGVTTYLKSSLKDSPIWSIVPNRLVLISCFTEDPWGKNVVITAAPAL